MISFCLIQVWIIVCCVCQCYVWSKRLKISIISHWISSNGFEVVNETIAGIIFIIIYSAFRLLWLTLTYTNMEVAISYNVLRHVWTNIKIRLWRLSETTSKLVRYYKYQTWDAAPVLYFLKSIYILPRLTHQPCPFTCWFGDRNVPQYSLTDKMWCCIKEWHKNILVVKAQ